MIFVFIIIKFKYLTRIFSHFTSHVATVALLKEDGEGAQDRWLIIIQMFIFNQLRNKTL